MRALAVCLLFLAAVPTLAQPPPPTPVVVPREDMQRRLAHANQVISEAVGSLQKRNPALAESLKAVRAELDQLREMLAAAPESKAVEEGQRMVGGMLTGTMAIVDREVRADGKGRHGRDGPGVVIIHPTDGAPRPPPSPAPPLVYPIQDGALHALKGAIEGEAFPRDQLRVLEQAAPSSWFLVAQVQQLLSPFAFPKDRLAAARLLKPRILDPENLFLLYGSFEFPSDKAELKKVLGQ